MNRFKKLRSIDFGSENNLFPLRALFFEKKGTKNYTILYSIPFISVLHQNKILHSQKGEASDFWMHNMVRLGPAMRPIDWRNEVPDLPQICIKFKMKIYCSISKPLLQSIQSH